MAEKLGSRAGCWADWKAARMAVDLACSMVVSMAVKWAVMRAVWRADWMVALKAVDWVATKAGKRDAK